MSAEPRLTAWSIDFAHDRGFSNKLLKLLSVLVVRLEVRQMTGVAIPHHAYPH